jgi:hypothetical protein
LEPDDIPFARHALWIGQGEFGDGESYRNIRKAYKKAF